MNAKRTASDRARHKAIREEFRDCPSQEELEASGTFEGPIKGGAYFLVRALVHDLKKSRIKSGLTLGGLAKRTGLDQTEINRLETGRVPNPTIDMLWRYATALGSRLVLSHVNKTSRGHSNGKAVATARK